MGRCGQFVADDSKARQAARREERAYLIIAGRNGDYGVDKSFCGRVEIERFFRFFKDSEPFK